MHPLSSPVTVRKRSINLKCCQLCYNVIPHTCESCVRKGTRKASATDLERSAFVGTDLEERQDRRLDQRRPLAGVASQARRRPIMKRSRDADLLRGISHNQRVGITLLLVNSG